MAEEINPFKEAVNNAPKKKKQVKKSKKTFISVENFPLYVKGTCGILGEIAKKYSCPRVAIKNFLDKNPNMIDYVEQESQSMLDMAENKLQYLMMNGEEKVQLNSAQFILKNLAKDRGYTEKTIVEHEGIGEVKINVIMPKAPEEEKEDDSSD